MLQRPPKQLQLNITSRHVQQILNEYDNLVYWSRKKASFLIQLHKKKCTEYVKEKVTWGNEKKANVVFSDEKKFNLDGLDRIQCYWHDLHKEQIFPKRPLDGGSVIILGSLYCKKKVWINSNRGLAKCRKLCSSFKCV